MFTRINIKKYSQTHLAKLGVLKLIRKSQNLSEGILQVTQKVKKISLASDFLPEMVHTKRQRSNAFKLLRGNYFKSRILHIVKYQSSIRSKFIIFRKARTQKVQINVHFLEKKITLIYGGWGIVNKKRRNIQDVRKNGTNPDVA